MKKLFAVILCISLLFLPACQQSAKPTPSAPGEIPQGWNWFYWNALSGIPDSITYTRTADDAETTITIAFNGTEFTISDEAGSRTYAHLINSPHCKKTYSGCEYTEYFLLSDDPEMTIEQYQQAMASQSNAFRDMAATEIIFEVPVATSSAVSYGEIPAEINTLLSLQANKIVRLYGEHSIFLSSYVAMSSTQTAHILERYDYFGTLLSTVTIKGSVITAVVEMNDGGFLVAVQNYSEAQNDFLLCFDAEGNSRWEYSFSPDSSVYMPYLFQKDSDIYCFGEIDAKGGDDLYFCKFSTDGAFLAAQTIGGSNFDSLHHIEQTDTGFIIYGSTQSRDGDLPFSKNGYGASFRAELSDDLAFSHAEAYPDSEYVFYHYGFHQGTPIYDNNPIMSPEEADRLPDGVISEGIFAFGDGYVILRIDTLSPYAFTSPAMSYQPHYRQLIATCYDADGNPIWQTVSEPYVS